MNRFDGPALLYAIGLVGVMPSAVSGALAAGRKRLDWVGVFVIATVTSIGGGTLRDVLLGRPPFWIRDPNYVLASLLAAALTLIYVRFLAPPRRSLLVADALGLAFFSISGAQITAQLHMPSLVVVLMGTITGAAGGVFRDVLIGEVPLLFRQSELYATVAVAGVTVYLLLEKLGVDRTTATLTGMAVIAALRLAAIFWRIQLPVFDVPSDDAGRK